MTNSESRVLAELATDAKRVSVFWSKAQREASGCLVWRGATGKNDRALWVSCRTSVSAARVSWLLTHGPIPSRRVLQTCGNARCIEPSHLVSAVTHSAKTFAERFWEKVNKNGPVVRPELGPCWEWTSALFKSGYGAFNIGIHAKTDCAHVVVWQLTHGQKQTEPLLRHRCDNKRCVNPDHLVPGTHAQNGADMVERGRSTRGKVFLRGSQIGGSRLNEQAVREIRARAEQGVTLAQIGRERGISIHLVWSVVRRKSWKHVA